MSRVRPWPLAVALLAAACGHSAPTTLHTLVTVPPAAPSKVAYTGTTVRVDAVALPAALDRLELLRETASGSFTVAEFDRWAAPPARLARQALTDDLILRLPPGTVAAPAAGGAPVEAIAVEVLAFSPGPARATLRASWTRGCRPGDASRRAMIDFDGTADTPPAALAALLGRLADAIAQDLSLAPDACPAPDPPKAAPAKRP